MKGTEANPFAFKCLARGCGAVFAKAWDYMAHIDVQSIEEWGPLLGTKGRDPGQLEERGGIHDQVVRGMGNPRGWDRVMMAAPGNQ